MYAISDIEAITGVALGAAVRAADQSDMVRGAEVALRSGA